MISISSIIIMSLLSVIWLISGYLIRSRNYEMLKKYLIPDKYHYKLEDNSILNKLKLHAVSFGIIFAIITVLFFIFYNEIKTIILLDIVSMILIVVALILFKFILYKLMG